MATNDKDNWTEISADTDSEVWDRKDPIEGRLLDKRSNVGPNESWLYKLKVEDGIVTVWGSTVLDTKFESIEVGSRVKIEPQGEVKSEKTGRKYQDFKVFYKSSSYKEAGEEEIDTSDIPF